MSLNGLAVLNIELTSRCNKSCFMCGRRAIEKDHPEIEENWGDMQFKLVEHISTQVPEDITIQFHNNGEPTLYPKLKEALQLFPRNIRCFNTNGKLLVDKAFDIIGNLETLTVSVIQDDDESDEQYKIVKDFLAIKGDNKPYMVYRLLGEIKNKERWEKLPGLITTRPLHNALGSFNYKKKVTIPEVGFCLDLMNHLCINKNGSVSICVRFDPDGHGILGHLLSDSLEDLWNSPMRRDLIKEHLKGNRAANKLCEKCHFYGVPRGVD